MSERVSIGGADAEPGGGLIAEAVVAWRRIPGGGAARRDRLARLWTRAEVLRLTNLRAQRASGAPGPEGSVAKLGWAELNKDIASFVLELLGPDGQLKPGGYPMERSEGSNLWIDAQHGFLRSRANSLEGGTSEILRNILGEQVLGLPREPSGAART